MKAINDLSELANLGISFTDSRAENSKDNNITSNVKDITDKDFKDFISNNDIEVFDETITLDRIYRKAGHRFYMEFFVDDTPQTVSTIVNDEDVRIQYATNRNKETMISLLYNFSKPFKVFIRRL